MNTNTLEYIIAIAEERSISKAALRFYLTQADLSRHLKRVESDLGTRLFTRHSGGVELTRAGIIFVNDARAILHMETELMRELKAMRHRAQHTIHVMVDEPFYNFFVQTASPRFAEMYSDYTLVYESCNSIQAKKAILDGRADFGVFYSATSQTSEMEYLVFDSVSIYLAFPKDYQGLPTIGGMKQAMNDGMPIILYPAGSTARMMEEEALIGAGIYPQKILEGNARNKIAYISQGGVCGILSATFCTQEICSKITVGDPLLSGYVVIAYSKNKTFTPAMQDLMQIVIDSAPR